MISLNYRDTNPIYEQIKSGFKSMILTGALAEDEKLPSVRELAMELAINPNTIQRAYRELEQDGYIYSVAGKGSFVSGGMDVKNKRINECKAVLSDMVRELKSLGVSVKELIKLIEGGSEKND